MPKLDLSSPILMKTRGGFVSAIKFPGYYWTLFPSEGSGEQDLDLVKVFENLNGGAPAYIHPSGEYVSKATATLEDTSRWNAQTNPGGDITFTGGVVTVPEHANQRIVRLTLAKTLPAGSRARVWWKRIGGTGTMQPRLGPTNQNVTSTTIGQLGWFSADIETNTDKTYLEFRCPGGQGAVSFSHVCVEVVDLATPCDILILAGQSNMVGASSGSPADPEIDLPHPDVWVMHGSNQSGRGAAAGQIAGLTAPIQHRSFNNGLGPGSAFARWYAENILETGRKLLVIAAAEGGTSLVSDSSPWNRNGTSPTLYNAMIADAQSALALHPQNRIAGVFWCQGEADRGAVSGPNYVPAFTSLVEGVRTDLGNPAIPFIISGLNPNAKDGPESTAAMIGFQESLAEGGENGIPGVTYSGWDTEAWGDGTKDMPDNTADTVHFSSDANRLRGVAAAQAVNWEIVEDEEPVRVVPSYVQGYSLLGEDGVLSASAAAAGNLVIGFLTNGNAGQTLSPVPFGWNELGSLDQHNMSSRILYRVMAAGDDRALPCLSMNATRGHYMVFRGVDTEAPFAVFSDFVAGTGDNPVVHPAAVPLEPSVILAGYAHRHNATYPASPYVNDAVRVSSGYNQQFFGFTESAPNVPGLSASLPRHSVTGVTTGGYHSFALALTGALDTGEDPDPGEPGEPDPGPTDENYVTAVMADGPALFVARNSGSSFGDVSGNSNHFTLGSSASFTGETLAGSAVLHSDGTLSGTSELGALPNIAGTNDITIVAWIRTTMNANGYIINMPFQHEARSPEAFSGISMRTGGHFQWSWGGNVFALDAPNPVNDGGWHLITVRRQGETMAILVDGVKVAEEVLAGTASYPSNMAIYLGGKRWAVSERYYSGDLAGLAIFPKAISDARIAEYFALRDVPVDALPNEPGEEPGTGDPVSIVGVSTSGGTALTAQTAPADAQAGDLAIWLGMQGGGGTQEWVNPPEGFDRGTYNKAWIRAISGARILQGPDEFQEVSAAMQHLHCLVLRNAVGIADSDGWVENSNTSDTFTVPSLTVTEPGSRILVVALYASNQATEPTTPDGLKVIPGFTRIGSSSTRMAWISDPLPAGTYGPFSATSEAPIVAMVWSGVILPNENVPPPTGGGGSEPGYSDGPSAPATPLVIAPLSSASLTEAQAKSLIVGRDDVGHDTNDPMDNHRISSLAWHAASGDTAADSRLLAQLRSLANATPSMKLEGGYGSQQATAPLAAIAMARWTPRVWDQLIPEHQTRLGLLIDSGLYATAFVVSENSAYANSGGKSERSLRGDTNTGRDWNPNYRVGQSSVFGCVAAYYAADGGPSAATATMASKLANFRVDDHIAALDASGGLANTRKTWERSHWTNAPTVAEIETAIRGFRRYGGDITTWWTIILEDSKGAWNRISNTGLNGGAGVSGGYGALAQGHAGLPTAGLMGMGTEYDSIDGGGLRSSMEYVWGCAKITTPLWAALIVANMVNPEDPDIQDLFSRFDIGRRDLDYKWIQGYLNYSNGKTRGHWRLDAPAGSNYHGNPEVWGRAHGLEHWQHIVDAVL